MGVSYRMESHFVLYRGFLEMSVLEEHCLIVAKSVTKKCEIVSFLRENGFLAGEPHKNRTGVEEALLNRFMRHCLHI